MPLLDLAASDLKRSSNFMLRTRASAAIRDREPGIRTIKNKAGHLHSLAIAAPKS